MTEFTDGLALRSAIWNMPIKLYDNRIILLNSILEQWVDEFALSGKWARDTRPLEFLEIGVWKAETIAGVQRHFQNVFNYVGLDPYGMLVDDPYAGLFWKSDDESTAVYNHAIEVFGQNAGQLVRVSSDDFFKDSTRNFDVVFVDGDHRYGATSRDLKNSLSCLRPGGLMIVDDVGNNFHPEVEWAVRDFAIQHEGQFDKYGSHPLFFCLDGMPIPVMLQFAVFRKAG